MKINCILVCSLFLFQISFAQKITGTALNDKGELLPFSSILVKGSTKGVTANNDARFEINLD